MAETFFKKQVIDKYFLDRQCPYTKRRPFRMKTLYWSMGVSLGLFVFVVIFFGDGGQKQESAASSPDYNTRPSALANQAGSPAMESPGSSSRSGSFSSSSSGVGYAGGGLGGSGSGRTRTANQVIRRGQGGNDPGSQLPMGYGIPVKLLNAVLSTNSATPVVAEITEDVLAHGSLSIPATSRAIGNATYDEASHRIQLRFHTFVYPEGDQHTVQAIGLMSDGSAGVAGDYHSGTAKRQIGRFLGNFIGGLADGMKERQQSGMYGGAFEPGSIRNGILNGVTLSAEDQGKSLSEDLSQTKPTMSLPAGQPLILFLEREYLP